MLVVTAFDSLSALAVIQEFGVLIGFMQSPQGPLTPILFEVRRVITEASVV